MGQNENLKKNKIEEIGKVKLDYSDYSGEDLYCDGDVEDELLEMTRVYRKRMDEIYPPVPQLRPKGAASCGDEDKAFLI